MKLNLTVMARSVVAETAWARELAPVFAQVAEVEVGSQTEEGRAGHIVFVDGTEGEELPAELQERLKTLDRRGRAVFMILSEKASRCEALEAGLVDDVLTYPFRPLDVLGRVRHYQQIMMWSEVEKLNASFSELIGNLREDLGLAERMQKARLAPRFSDIKGFRVAQRTVVGWKSGDHVELAESRDGNQLSIVMSDSSSSRLSSAVLSVLMRVAVKLSTDEVRSSLETVKRIHEELALTLGDKDRFSLFYGVVSRKDYRLKYVNFGTSCAFRAQKGQGFEALPVHGEAITKSSGFPPGGVEIVQTEIELEPQDRLVLLTDGFVETVGGPNETLRLLNDYRDRDAADLLNELSYRVKSLVPSDDEMPPQDSTAVLFDVADRLIRLAK